MFVFAGFETEFSYAAPKDAIVGDESGRRYKAPLPVWAQPWDLMTFGGFPIPADMWPEVCRQLAHKKHAVFNPLLQLQCR